MRRSSIALLAASSSVTIVACSTGDIVVKTDLDEKYIVRNSAVTTPPFDWDKKLDIWKETIKTYETISTGYEASEAECRNGILRAAVCSDIFGPGKNNARVELAKSKENLAALNKFRASETNPITSIRYRPIFVDVNNEKTAMGYVSLTCLNPDVSKKDAKRLFALLEIKEDEVSKKKTPRQDAYTAVSLEVCKKYAYPNTTRFSYSIDEDQTKDKANK